MHQWQKPWPLNLDPSSIVCHKYDNYLGKIIFKVNILYLCISKQLVSLESVAIKHPSIVNPLPLNISRFSYTLKCAILRQYHMVFVQAWITHWNLIVAYKRNQNLGISNLIKPTWYSILYFQCYWFIWVLLWALLFMQTGKTIVGSVWNSRKWGIDGESRSQKEWIWRLWLVLLLVFASYLWSE